MKSWFSVVCACALYLLASVESYADLTTYLRHSKESLFFSLDYAGKHVSESEDDFHLESLVSPVGVDRCSFSWKTEGFHGFVGKGKPSSWNALRKTSYSRPLAASSSSWSSTGEAMLVGFGNQAVRFFVMAREDENAMAASADRPSTDLASKVALPLRCAAFEINRTYRNLKTLEMKGSLAASLSEFPEMPVGSGWKAGSAGYPATTMLSISALGSIEAEHSSLGLWSSISANSLRPVSAAGSIQCRWNPAPWFKKRTMHSTNDGRHSTSLDVFLYLSDETYRNIEGTIPSFDRVMGFEIQGSNEAASFKLGATSQSLSTFRGSNTASILVRKDLGAWDSLLWQWKTDELKLGLSIEGGFFSGSSAISADAGGLKRGSLSLAMSSRKSLRWGKRYMLKLTMNFSKIEEGENSEDSCEGFYDEEGLAEPSMPKVHEAIHFQGASAYASCSWKPDEELRISKTLGSGDASMTLKLSGNKERLDLLFSFRISQIIFLNPRCSISLSVFSREEGYRFGIGEDLFPDIGLRLVWKGARLNSCE